MARRDERAYPPAVCERGTTKPENFFHENPPGGESFGRGLRWLGSHSPLRGCSDLAASALPKIPRRRTPPNFKTGSKAIDFNLRFFQQSRDSHPREGMTSS